MQTDLFEKTSSHYDEFPFIEGGPNRIAWWRGYLRDFLPDDHIRDRLIADVGSSIGEISRGLLDRGARLVCLDISFESLQRCQEINPEPPVIHGNALDLPFPDDAFDHTISIGVLHHTPDCRRGFHEVARVTAPGGTIVIFLYNYWSIYNLVYHSFKPIRATIPLKSVPRQLVRILQPFVKSHLDQKLDDEQLRNLLGDKLWTPQATFHSVSEVRRWGIEEGLTLEATKKFFLGYANVMKFKKTGQNNNAMLRELELKCLECGATPMTRNDTRYTCAQCGHIYQVDRGIIRTLME
jgi:SAM-dependent methyltransferase